jgi:hypothetical protein
MTSIDTNILFSTKANLYCHINYLFIRHADALKSKSAWVSIITSLLHLTMIGIKKHGDGFEDKFGPISLHGASRFNFAIPTKTIHACFLTPLVVDYNSRYGTLVTS